MTETHICKNCLHHFQGKFCNMCGEKLYGEKDRSIKHLFGDLFHFIFHFEGTLPHTIKTFFKSPGKVSLDYCNGIRRPYFKPLSLFLLVVVLYLIFPYFQGLNQKLYYYMEHGTYGQFARHKITITMRQTGMTFNELSDVFSEKSAKISKFLLLVLIPLTAVVLWLMAFNKKRFFYDHVIFAAEINTIYILVSFLLLPLVIATTQFIYHQLTGRYIPIEDGQLTLIILPLLILYISVATYRFYNFRKLKAFLFALLFLGIHNIILMALVYKFILFNVVINSIH